MNIKLSEKHGLNPCMLRCPVCGGDAGIALLGGLPGDKEAPRYAAAGEPCDACKAIQETKVQLIEVDSSGARTGKVFTVSEEACTELFNEDIAQEIRKSRVALIDSGAAAMVMSAAEGVASAAGAEAKGVAEEAGEEVTAVSVSSGPRDQFNYVRAWFDLAWPAVQALPENVKALFREACTTLEDIQQDKNLLVQAPPELLRKFEALSSGELSTASRAFHAYGHWSPFGHVTKTSGVTWKFANVADQVLQKREASGSTLREGAVLFTGKVGGNVRLVVTSKVLEGMLRVCVEGLVEQRGSYWTWREVGLADNTIDLAPFVQAIRDAYSNSRNSYITYTEANALLKQHFPVVLDWDASRFMTTREEMDEDIARARGMSSEGWEV